METFVEVLVPGEGGFPENGVDSGGAVYTEWDVGDEALFTVPLPDRHDGGAVGIRLDVLGTSGRKHKWRVRVSRAGSQLGETFAEFIGTGSEVTESIVALEGTSSLSSGDTLSFSVSRVAAAAFEDEAPALLYGLRFYCGVAVAAISSCSGRVGKIVDSVLIRFNDPDQKHISATEIVVFINDLIRDLAQRRVFRRSVWVELEAGQHIIDLTEFGADVIDVVTLGFQEIEDGYLWNVSAVNDPWNVEKFRQAYGPPRWYFNDGSNVDIAPTPESGGRLGAVAAYLPNDSSCDDGSLPTSAAYDQIYTAYCLRECHGRDWTATGAKDQWARYNALYEVELAKLMDLSTGSGRHVIGSRSLRHFRG